MSSLTREVKDSRSPVAIWLRTRLPHHKEIQATYRVAAGPCRVTPGRAVALGTQGGAIDWWLRILLDTEVSLDLPRAVLQRHVPACTEAGMALFDELGVHSDDPSAQAGRLDQLRARPDEWWARVCYALALLVEIYRNRMLENTRLMTLGPGSTLDDLLALANDEEVADLIALRNLARDRLLPALLPGDQIITGMTFDGSRDLQADGDLIANGMLIDFKSAQGRPRADGTRTAALSREDLDQLIGYTLMDYSDEYRLHTVAIYAARYGFLAAWPIDELFAELAGYTIDIGSLRRDFAELLRSLRR